MASTTPGAEEVRPPEQPSRWLGRTLVFGVFVLSGALAFGLVYWRQQNQRDSGGSPVGRARADILFLQSQVRSFLRATGRFPTEQEGLEALVKANLVRSVPTDPWDRPYVYRLDQGVGRVVSLGRDGIEGGSGEDADVDSSFSKGTPAVGRDPG